MTTLIQKIISGGQTGVDRAALDVSIRLGIPVGGWCPRDRWAEDGPISLSYPLVETDSSDPAARTLLNVQNSDGTLVIAPDPDSDRISLRASPAISPATSPGISPATSPGISPATFPGTVLAIDEARRLGKPVLLCNPVDLTSARSAFEWIVRERIDILNIAGPRSSEQSGIYGLAARFLLTLLKLGTGKEADESSHQDRQEE